MCCNIYISIKAKNAIVLVVTPFASVVISFISYIHADYRRKFPIRKIIRIMMTLDKQDHNTSNARERERVTAMGGVIKDNRVGGVLIPTR